jgi:predicted RNA-binding protein with PUA domain
MNYIETALYPYRICVPGSVYKIYLPEVDFEKVSKMIFDMKKSGEILTTVYFSQASKIINISVDASNIIAVENPFDKDPMIIKDKNGRYEAIGYIQRNEKEVVEKPVPSVAKYVRKSK